MYNRHDTEHVSGEDVILWGKISCLGKDQKMVNITTCIFVVNNDSFYDRCRPIKEYGKGAVVFAEAEKQICRCVTLAKA